MPCISRSILLEGFVYFMTASIVLPYPRLTRPGIKGVEARAAAPTIISTDLVAKIVLLILVALCCSCSKVLVVKVLVGTLSSEEQQ